MPVFSKLRWPFYLTATPSESTSNISSPNHFPRDSDLAQDGDSGAYSMSVAPDNEPANMVVITSFGGDGAKDVVESIGTRHSLQPADTAQKVGGVVEGGEHKASESGVAPTGASDEVGSRPSRLVDDVADGKDDGQSHPDRPDKTTDSMHRENSIDSKSQVKSEGAFQEQTTDQARSNEPDDNRSGSKSELPGDEQTTEFNHTEDKFPQLPQMTSKLRASKQADNSLQHEENLPSSPLPAYSYGSGEQTNGAAIHDEPQSEPSSDSVFLQRMRAHFHCPNRTSGSHSVLSEASQNDLLKGPSESFTTFNERKFTQQHLDSAGSATPSTGSRDVGITKKHPSSIRDEQGVQQHSNRLENAPRKGVSHGPIDEPHFQEQYYSLQQPRSEVRSPPLPPPFPRGMMPNLHHGQIFTSFTPGISDDGYGPDFSSSVHGYHMPDRAMHEHHASAQLFRKDYLDTQKDLKRKHSEELDEDQDEAESELEDNYTPSESGDDEESGSESDLDSDEPLMHRNLAATTRCKRASSSHSEYQDEGAEDEDQGEESENQDMDPQEAPGTANKDAEAGMEEGMEVVQYMDLDTRSPTHDPVQDMMEPTSSLGIELAHPSASAAGPSAIQRSLPVLQPKVALEGPPSDVISFKLPQYHVEVMPLKAKDDYPEVRVNLPGMMREILILTPDHAYQEIHLLKHLFMPGQQSLATPDPSPMVALLNFHTVATMVLEAYTSYEVGDLEVKKSTSGSLSNKKQNETEALDATKDEIFFAVMDRWRVGLAEETLRPSYKLIRGVQEFCDITLDVIYYLEEHGFVDGPQMMRKERSDKGAKKSKDKKGGKKTGAGSGSDGDDSSEEPSPNKKRGRPSKAQSDSPAKGRKGKSKGEVNTLQARKKAKVTPNPKADRKKQSKAKKQPKVSVTPRKK